ncbi:MAG TPA: tRNA 2-thiouridine(34) synthase MnmA [Candidatus Avidesulfovibrio excrementigallinarum]|nr:tRNA 2-thiouridine(34) synthase MnmA [Candidatus Avidesulfovibrio excrementigallinarum]
MIAVAVSGGVDSLYALMTLKDRGESVMALHGRFRAVAPEEDPVPGLEENCRRLGVKLVVADLAAPFHERVVRPFAESYAAGATPNPCALCNARIKFGLLLDAALEQGADVLATGHYARRAEHPRYGVALAPAADKDKDQSYFLALTPGQRLARALFPLAGTDKAAVRAGVEARGLVAPLPKESQEICFVPGNEYRRFLELAGVRLPGPGPVVYVAGEAGDARDGAVIGVHQGLWRYTEGQRRGLGIAWSEPLYVVGKDVRHNRLLAGPAAALCQRRCTAGEVNVLVDPALWPQRLFVRIRYREKMAPARVGLVDGVDGGRLEICFDSPKSPGAPGQIAVVYDEEGIVLAGGVILASSLEADGAAAASA